MSKEMREYIKECDCEAIQQLWKPKESRDGCLYIPSLSWLKEKMGKKLYNLYSENRVWICKYYSKFKLDCAWTVKSSSRLACIEALKIILNERFLIEPHMKVV